MANPVLVVATRAKRVESSHRAALAVVDADGARVLALGDVEIPVFPRSAVKALQALPLVETGAADRYGLGDRELAIAAGSHAGEPDHVAAVEQFLARRGLDATALECGAHWPLDRHAADALVRAGRDPTALHNNCSGKHAGFLCVAGALGIAHADYVKPEHPVQGEVRAAIETTTGASLGADVTAVDGCSVPTWAVPLDRLALGFARFGTGHGLRPSRAQAAARIRAACAAQPHFVAGTGRFATVLMQHFRERAFIKPGAEGVFCAALPQQGLGIALKCDDGASRAAEVIVAALLARFLPGDAADLAVLDPYMRPTLRNWNGIAVGTVALTGPLVT